MSPKLHYPAIVQLDSTLGSQYPGTPDYLGYQRLLKFPWLRSKLIKNNLQKVRANLICWFVMNIKQQGIGSIYFWNDNTRIEMQKCHSDYHKVTSSRLGYYSILYPFAQRSQCISIKFPLHK